MANATATPAPARLAFSPIGPGRRASHWERARAGCLTFANAALTPRTQLLGLAWRAPQPGNHRQSRWPLRKLADRSLRPSVRSPEPGAARPGHSTAEAVGHLASLAKPSRRQPRPAADCLSGSLTAGQCFSFARLRDPAKWLVPRQLSGTLRPRSPPDSAALICCAYLALHCAGYTDSARSISFQSATQFKQPRLAKALAVVPVRQTKPASIRALRSPDLQKTRRQSPRWPQGPSSLSLLALLEPSLHSGSR